MRFPFRVLSTFGAQILVVSVGLLSNIIVARTLGPGGKGAYSLALQVSGFAVAFGGLGLDLAIVYFTGKESFAERDLKPTLLWFGAAWGSVVGIAALGLASYLHNSALKDVSSQVLLPAILLIPFILIFNYQRAFLLGRNQLLKYNGLNIFRALAICVALLVILLGVRRGLVGAVWAYAMANVIALGVVLKLTGTCVTWPTALKNTRILKDLISFGLKPQLSNFLQLFSYRLDMFILNAFRGPAIVGYYSIATILAEVVWYLPNAISLVLLPQMVITDRENAERITPIICRNTLLVSLLASLAVAAFAPLIIIFLFSRAFLPALVPLWCLLPGVVALSLDKPIASYQTGQGRPEIAFYVAALATPVTLAAYLLLIPRFGINGAAVGSSISYVFTTAVEVYFLFRVSSIRFLDLVVPHREDILFYRSFLGRLVRSLPGTGAGYPPSPHAGDPPQ